MDTPPIHNSLFKQLLKQSGVVINDEPLEFIKTTSQNNQSLSSWEGLISNLVSQK